MKFGLRLLVGGVAALSGLPALARLESSPRPAATATADEPTKKDKAGTPTGEVHGGKEGTTFQDKAGGRLTKIAVRSGSWLDSIQCTWDDAGTASAGTVHGGEGGEEQVITLEPGETLVEVTGTILEDGDTVVIGSLSFKTTKRTVGPMGESTEGKKFTLTAPKGQEICGFQGRSGDYLDAIGMLCRPLP